MVKCSGCGKEASLSPTTEEMVKSLNLDYFCDSCVKITEEEER